MLIKLFIILKVADLCCAQVVTPEMRQLVNRIFEVQELLTRSASPIDKPESEQRISEVFESTTKRIPQAQNASTEYARCGFQKECVPRFLCNDGEIIKNGESIIDIRGDKEAQCSYLQVCCDIRHKVKEPVISPKQKSSNIGCGFRNTNGVIFRITGDVDNEAQFGEFPWMVAILSEEQIPSDPPALYKCGGALITDTVVVTAAHCVQHLNAGSLFVRAGEWDTSSTSEALPHQDRRVHEIIMHEHFHNATLRNDIALVLLESPFVWDDHIGPVCLPPPHTNFDASRCLASGWGRNKFGRDSNLQVILKKVELPVVPNQQCQRSLRRTRLGGNFRLHPSFMCAGGEPDLDTCSGDGGSPLVCPVPGSPDRYYHAGIVAWGVGCGMANIPGVYVNVPHLRTWIDKTLEHKNIALSDFRL